MRVVFLWLSEALGYKVGSERNIEEMSPMVGRYRP